MRGDARTHDPAALPLTIIPKASGILRTGQCEDTPFLPMKQGFPLTRTERTEQPLCLARRQSLLDDSAVCPCR